MEGAVDPVEENKRAERLWTPVFIVMFLVSLMSNAGFYMTMPTLPKYAISIQIPLEYTGLITGVFSIAAIIARPFAGFFSDRLQKRSLLMVSMALTAVSACGYALTHTVEGLLFFRIMHGISFAVSSTVQMAMTADLIPASRMGEGIGYMSISQILAMSIAPGLGLQLVDWSGFSATFLFAGSLIAFSAILTVTLPRVGTTVKNRKSLRASISLQQLVSTKLLLLAAMGALFSLMNSVTSSYLALLGDERGIVNISIFFTISSVAVAIIRPMMGKIADKRGLAFVLIPSLTLSAVSMVMVGRAFGLLPIAVAALLKGAAQSGGQTTIQAECARRSTVERRGVGMSTFYIGSDLGNSVGAAMGGWLSAICGYGNMFIIVGFVVAAGLLMLWLQCNLDHKNRTAA